MIKVKNIQTIHADTNGWLINKGLDTEVLVKETGDTEKDSQLEEVHRAFSNGLKALPMFTDTEQNVSFLNIKRDSELKQLAMSESLIKTLESVIAKAKRQGKKVAWIGTDNKKVQMSIDEATTLLDEASDKVEEIYFRYRDLKDKQLKKRRK